METVEQYASRRALTALRNARSRAKKHIAKGDHAAANRTFLSGMSTVQRWLTGKHPDLKNYEAYLTSQSHQ